MTIKFLFDCQVEFKDDPADDSYTEDISGGEEYNIELVEEKGDCISAKFSDGSIAVDLPKELFIFG